MTTLRTKKQVVEEFRRTEIIEAAREVVVRDGLAAASMDKIAELAGVAKGTLYLYFASKDRLIEAMNERGHQELAARMEPVIAMTGPPQDVLRAYIHTVLTFSVERAIVFRTMPVYPEHGRTPAARRIAKRIEAYLAFVAGTIQRGVAARQFRPCEPRVAARVVIECLRALVIERLRQNASVQVDADTESLMQLLFHGLAVRGDA